MTGTRSVSGSNYPTSWTNGSETLLGSFATTLPQIEVVGSDVYVIASNGAGVSTWKNGALQSALSGGPNVGYGPVSVAGSGTDVYFCASGKTSTDPYGAVYVWKNSGSPVLTINTTSTTSIVRSGFGCLGVSSLGDIYIAGWAGTSVVYWKNGTQNVLPGTLASHVYGLAIREY